jgi:muconolactone delta-isomerase
MVKRTFEMFASKQDSRIVANYPFAGERGGLAIVEVNSGDELQELLGGLPFAPIVTLEIHAVGSIQASLKTVDQVQQQMANMIPAGVG